MQAAGQSGPTRLARWSPASAWFSRWLPRRPRPSAARVVETVRALGGSVLAPSSLAGTPAGKPTGWRRMGLLRWPVARCVAHRALWIGARPSAALGSHPGGASEARASATSTDQCTGAVQPAIPSSSRIEMQTAMLIKCSPATMRAMSSILRCHRRRLPLRRHWASGFASGFDSWSPSPGVGFLLAAVGWRRPAWGCRWPTTMLDWCVSRWGCRPG